MKNQLQAKSVHNVTNPAEQRTEGVRPAVARTWEHRYERRKIREQLRRLDWALNAEDEVFA
jgi:hypothetical protein